MYECKIKPKEHIELSYIVQEPYQRLKACLPKITMVLKMESMRSFRSKNNERTKKYVSDHMLGYINGDVEIPQLLQCCLRITYLFFPLLTKDVSFGQQRMGNCFLCARLVL
ncbi:hypothetical protein ACOSP7_013210 [Xanthoceras sorbifolium]